MSRLHTIRCLADSYAADQDIDGFNTCLKKYIRGLNKPRQNSVPEKKLASVFSTLPSVTEDFYDQSIMQLILDDSVGYGPDCLVRRANTSYKFWAWDNA